MAFEPISKLARELDPSSARAQSFDGFVFLCGGQIADSSSTPLKSARQFAFAKSVTTGNKLAGREVILAERATTLLQGSDYSDLLQFEEHLGALAACIVIFVESPGSIAELGCFAATERLASKLLVVCEARYESKGNSFIFLGPIAQLRRDNAQSVHVFPFHEEDSSGHLLPSENQLDDCWEDIDEAIGDFVKRAIPEAKLDPADLGHQLLLIADLIDLCVALRLNELLECLKHFKCNLRLSDAKRCIGLLEKFKLVIGHPWGNERFYFSCRNKQFVKFRRLPALGGTFDRLRFKSEISLEYSSDDRRKAKAIRAYLKVPAS